MGGITQSTFSFISSQSGSFTSFRRWKKSQISLYFLTLSGSTHMRGSLTRVRVSPPTQQIPSPILGHTVWSTQFIQTESDASFLVLGGQGSSIQARPLDKSLQIALPSAHHDLGMFQDELHDVKRRRMSALCCLVCCRHNHDRDRRKKDGWTTIRSLKSSSTRYWQCPSLSALKMKVERFL